METHTKDGKEVPGTGVTAHGIRRATVAWAGRCGADLLGVRSNGEDIAPRMRLLLAYLSCGCNP